MATAKDDLAEKRAEGVARSKRDILQHKWPTVDVDVGGLTLTLRGMSAGAVESFSRRVEKYAGDDAKEDAPPGFLRALLLCQCIVGIDGKRIFTDDEWGELAESMPHEAMGKFWKEAAALSGMEVTDPEKND